MEKEIICKRCGKCCFVQSTGKPCKFLVKLSNNKTCCRIYNQRDRLGKLVYNEPPTYCNLRVNVDKLYDGCPYNETILSRRNQTNL